VDSNGRVVEMDDDPMLREAGPSRGTSRSRRSRDDREQGLSSGHDHAVADSHSSNLRPDDGRQDDRPSSSRSKSSVQRKPVVTDAGERK
jgi:hypothetical protein